MRDGIKTDKAPLPLGPYSQAIRTDRLVFTSGQIGIDPASGRMVAGGVDREAEQVFENLRQVLTAAGTDLNRAVKVTVFLADLADFGRVNEIYARQFAEPYPARSCFGVAALPAGARVEIEVVAAL